jgi:amino acid permease
MADLQPKVLMEKVASSASGDPVSIQQASTGLKKDISNRQFVFMAMGGSIGAGLLLASSLALQVGGPGSLVFGM